MSGHSKWSQIKRKKGIKDQQRGKLFSKLSRQITLAVLEGGGATDPAANVKLRMAIDQARSENMPKENIQRAIEKGTGPDKQSLQEAIYEGFGPKGIVFLIQTTTDNSNRTYTEVRNVLDKKQGKMGNQGSVNYMFQRAALITFDKAANDEDAIFDFADKIQASDIEDDGTSINVYFPFENLGRASDSLNGLQPVSPPDLDYRPTSTIKVDDKETANKVLSLVEALEGLDDVQRVFSNFDIPEEFLT